MVARPGLEPGSAAPKAAMLGQLHHRALRPHTSAGKYSFGAAELLGVFCLLVFFHWRTVAKNQGTRISSSNIWRIQTAMDRLGSEIREFKSDLNSYQSAVRMELFTQD